MKATIIKLKNETKHFRKNQKVWLVQETGDDSVKVVGRYKGRHRYVTTWIKKVNIERLIIADVSTAFAEKHSLLLKTSPTCANNPAT